MGDGDRRGHAGWARHGRRQAVAAVIAAVLAVSACGSAVPAAPLPSRPSPAPAASQPAVSPRDSTPAAASGQREVPDTSAGLLAGKIIGIDPGHNGGNFTDPAAISHQIWNGAGWEPCDTTGTATDGGYTEARFNFNVARYLRADLRRNGARVVMTRATDDGVGPCVDQRSEIINDAHADVAVDIHADGGPASGRGFTILEPVADGPNDKVIAASARFGSDVQQALLAGTTMPESTYVGVDGIMQRDDLAGLNLTSVAKVLVECGNMRNAADARLLVTAGYQQSVARALEQAIIRVLG